MHYNGTTPILGLANQALCHLRGHVQPLRVTGIPSESVVCRSGVFFLSFAILCQNVATREKQGRSPEDPAYDMNMRNFYKLQREQAKYR